MWLSVVLSCGWLVTTGPPSQSHPLSTSSLRPCAGCRRAVQLQMAEESESAQAEAEVPEAEAEELYRPPRIDDETITTGQVVECTVMGKLAGKGDRGLFAGYVVDIGASKPALVPRSHVALKPNQTIGKGVVIGQGWADLPVGMVLEGQVLSATPAGINVSFSRAQKTLAWTRVSQLAAEDVTLEAPVLRLTEAGATLDVEGLPAFLPWSHWALPVEQRTWERHGELVPVKFLEADRVRRRLVVSNRRVRVESALAAVEMGGLAEGQFGAVVELDCGLQGLLHVSQISQVFVKNVSACFSVGDRVRSVVIKVDENDGAVSLSTKMLENKPGEMLRDPAAIYERAVAQSKEEDAVVGADAPGADAAAAA